MVVIIDTVLFCYFMKINQFLDWMKFMILRFKTQTSIHLISGVGGCLVGIVGMVGGVSKINQ